MADLSNGENSRSKEHLKASFQKNLTQKSNFTPTLASKSLEIAKSFSQHILVNLAYKRWDILTVTLTFTSQFTVFIVFELFFVNLIINHFCISSHSIFVLISAFVFATRIEQFLYFLHPKFPAFSHLCLFVSDLFENLFCWFSDAAAHLSQQLDRI